MPLTKRCISPIDVSLHRLPASVRQNELECVANGTLANLVRQLSSLSKHAEDIFGELCREAMKIEHKTQSFFSRIDRISAKVTQLDSNVEEVSLQDLHLRKPFKSCTLIDQQSLSRQTMPAAMAECYSACDKPPELNKLNPYRTDGKSGLEFYTCPEYFFQLWRQDMLKDVENHYQAKKAKSAKSKHGSGDKKHKNRRKQKADPLSPSTTPVQEVYAATNRTNFGAAPISANNANHTTRPNVQYSKEPAYGRQESATTTGVAAPAVLAAPPHNRTTAPAINSSAPLFNLTNYSAAIYGSTSCAMMMTNNNNNNTINSTANNINTSNYRAGSLQHYDGGFSNIDAKGSFVSGGDNHIVAASSPDESQASTYESDQSKLSSSACRPIRPPPAPPMSANGPAYQPLLNNNSMTISPASDLYTGIVKQLPASSVAVVQKGPSANGGGGATTRSSQSPDLPPPPPPLYDVAAVADDDLCDTLDRATFFQQAVNSTPLSDRRVAVRTAPPPPPPPPPPPTMMIQQQQQKQQAAQQNGSGPAPKPPPPPTLSNFSIGRIIKSPTSGGLNGPAPTDHHKQQPARAPSPDGRSDLLRAIREGIQLKKVERVQEKQREQDALSQSHDVAAILRKRMEDVMGRRLSDQSSDDGEAGDVGPAPNDAVSDLDDEWDD